MEEKTSSLEGISDQEIFIKEYEEKISYDTIEHAIQGWTEIDNKKIPLIDPHLMLKDHLGTINVRLGIGRYSYKIPPGLYGVGEVDEKSPILVTANYKLSFDTLRKELTKGAYWILVLDTQGINVWCAAGKGIFSSRELIYQIHKWGLKRILKTRTLILPQLGSTSMEPHLIRKYTGFRVVYGPVRSQDVEPFIEGNLQATEDMRRVRFTLKDRLILTPLEIILHMKYVFMVFIYFCILNLLNGNPELWSKSIYNTLPFIIANITGSFVFPILLPLLPFRSFSANGALLGSILGGMILKYFTALGYNNHLYSMGGIFLLLVGFVSYIAFNFTGSTTYTSFSGVKKETRIFLPILFTLLGAGILLTLLGNFL